MDVQWRRTCGTIPLGGAVFMRKTLLIGVTSRRTEVFHHDAGYCINDYIQYLQSAGIPVLPLILPLCDWTAASEAASYMDGLLIAGGNDIDPQIYGEEEDGQYDREPREYDDTDLRLYTAFRDCGKPVFGICRGIQLINAAEGGTLIQDIPSVIGSEHNQKTAPADEVTGETLHALNFVPGTRMYDLFGKVTRVNSYHHQAVDLPAPGFTVSAYAPDGIIEGIEKDRILAVQWHPELMKNSPAQVRLAAEFLSLCAASDR